MRLVAVATGLAGACLLAGLMSGCGPKAPPPPPPVSTATALRASTEAASAPADTRPPGANEVVVRVRASQATGLELVCASGYRARASVGLEESKVWRWGRFEAVTGDDCSLYFKGGTPARFQPVARGQALSCDIVGPTALCVPFDPTVVGRPPLPEPAPGVVHFELVDAPSITSVELRCPGKRRWVPVADGRATVDEVPRGTCRSTLNSTHAIEGPEVRGGEVLTCRITSAGAACTVNSTWVAEEAVLPPTSRVLAPEDLRIVLYPADSASQVELVCPGSGDRRRETVDAEGEVVFTDVPQGDCDLYFKGRAPGRFDDVGPGQELSCTSQGTVVSCRDTAGGR